MVTDENYHKTLERIQEIWECEIGSAEFQELDLLIDEVMEYEKKFLIE
jgi:hypothetical protein